jgi:hypothetical protein
MNGSKVRDDDTQRPMRGARVIRTCMVVRVLVCSLAVIGGFLLTLGVAWLLGLDGDWVPYAAHAIGAALGGVAIARQGGSWLGAAIGGALGIGLVAAVAFLSPGTFGWIAARATQPAVVAAALAAGSAVAAAAGAAIAGKAAPAGGASIVMLSTLVAAAFLLLGSRVAMRLLGLDMFSTTSTVLAASACSLLAAFATQWVVANQCMGLCASGTVVVLGWQVVQAIKANVVPDSQLLVLVIPVGAALVGARAAWEMRPRAIELKELASNDV